MKTENKKSGNGDSAKIEGSRTLKSDGFISEEIRDFFILTDYFGEDSDGYIYDPDTMEYVEEGDIEDEMKIQRSGNGAKNEVVE